MPIINDDDTYILVAQFLCFFLKGKLKKQNLVLRTETFF